MYDSDKCINPSLILALAESILNGNKLHNTLKEQGALSHPNLTVPEALLYCRAKYFNLKEWVINNLQIYPTWFWCGVFLDEWAVHATSHIDPAQKPLQTVPGMDKFGFEGEASWFVCCFDL